MTIDHTHRVQAEFSPILKEYLDQIVAATNSTKKEVIVDAVLMLREHILRCQQGYRKAYIKLDDPTKIIQVESKYDQLRLPYPTK